MKKVVIVGGGIAGMFTALLWKKKGASVTLVEKSDELGGLLRSQEPFEKGLFFDYGTHFLSETGITEIDEILFKGLEVRAFDYLKVGSYFNGLNEKNGFLSDEHLDNKALYFKELLTTKPSNNYNNLSEQLLDLFGQGYAENLIKPVVEKFFHTPSHLLVPNSHALFGLTRIMAGDADRSKELKKDQRFDAVLGYHSYLEGVSSKISMYPKAGGIGAWVTSLEKQLNAQGVNVVLNANIGNVKTLNGKVSSIEINDKSIALDELIWTVPPIFLLNKLQLFKEYTSPNRLTSCIFHFVVDQPYLTDLFYLYCYDIRLKSFRVTLYDNYSQGVEGKYRITVSSLHNKPVENIEDLQNEIFEELFKMSIIPENTKLLNKAFNHHPNGFPILTPRFVENSLEQNKDVLEHVSNVKIFGKANGKDWFMNDIIYDIYNNS